MPKSVKICIGVLAVVLILSAVSLLFRMSGKKSCFVEILQSGNVLYEMDISGIEYKLLRIESADGGWNEILIENGEIRVSAADCPDKNCCRMGYLDEFHNPIVCLPHKLIIKYKD